MTDQSIDVQKEGKLTFHRGSALSIFASDRREDFMALLVAVLITVGVYVLV
ncbi:MAG: hypothetical protein HQL38_02340 [Alphaproteobacteria bacterium]|nr:hypothetical protein [Alphaproteobacteria bacterium]MBF0336023.1 hypothetical protein [Alphaproteobacteria bacterium]MBF0391496.1 hypothetical protein [Alphaproteobacteria bacterium]